MCGQILVERLGQRQRYLHLYQEVALQKPLLDLCRIPILTFVQTTKQVIVEGIVIVNTVTNFGSNAAGKINVRSAWCSGWNTLTRRHPSHT